MKRIDGPQLAALSRGLYDLELAEARAAALAEMVNAFADAGMRATRALPMEAEPALFPPRLEALGRRGRA